MKWKQWRRWTTCGDSGVNEGYGVSVGFRMHWAAYVDSGDDVV